MATVLVPRVGGGRAFEHGVWKPIFTSTGPSASFTCPNCRSTYPLTHLSIDALTGVVAPDFVCLTPGCAIRGQLQLIGWPPGV